jgi:hypothetical protein
VHKGVQFCEKNAVKLAYKHIAIQKNFLGSLSLAVRRGATEGVGEGEKVRRREEERGRDKGRNRVGKGKQRVGERKGAEEGMWSPNLRTVVAPMCRWLSLKLRIMQTSRIHIRTKPRCTVLDKNALHRMENQAADRVAAHWQNCHK